jgi:hypothetical protein
MRRHYSAIFKKRFLASNYVPAVLRSYVAVADEVTARRLERYFKSGSVARCAPKASRRTPSTSWSMPRQCCSDLTAASGLSGPDVMEPFDAQASHTLDCTGGGWVRKCFCACPRIRIHFNTLLHCNTLNAKQMRFQLELMLLGMIEGNRRPRNV